MDSFWVKDPDISYTFSRLRSIYSRANALTTPREERFDFLLMACGDLSRQYRKGNTTLYPIAVAQTTAWFMSLAESFYVEWGGDILAGAMGEKYPAGHCGYCGKLPCVCNEADRAKHTPAICTMEQRSWSLWKWQSHLDTLYGKANEAGGVPRALNRLFEEVAEVGLLMRQADGFNDPLEELGRKIAREMTDVLAWTFTTSSLLKVDVQDSVRTLYGLGCPVCKHPECMCRSFERRPKTGHMTHRFMSAEEIPYPPPPLDMHGPAIGFQYQPRRKGSPGR